MSRRGAAGGQCRHRNQRCNRPRDAAS